MNVYDFDGTIYEGDCTLDFWRFCLGRQPRAWRALPGALLAGLQFKLGRKSRDYFKEQFYQFLPYVPDVESEIKQFWDISRKKIKPWYYQRSRADDLVISASPEFLLAEICGRLEIACLASQVDWQTGRLLGPNCRGAEKVRRFRQAYSGAEITEFYTDSRSDEPLARLAEQAFLVKHNKIIKWRLENEK